MCFDKGFDIQVKGPELESEKRNSTKHRGNSDEFRTILQKPGSARSADIFMLDPAATYKFRVIPKARMVEGVPSEVHQISPGTPQSGKDSGIILKSVKKIKINQIKMKNFIDK